MIPDASSWIIKFPKVPFTQCLQRAASTAFTKHSSPVRTRGGRAEETEKKGNDFHFIICPDNIIFLRSGLTSCQVGVRSTLSTDDTRSHRAVLVFTLGLIDDLNFNKSGVWSRYIPSHPWHCNKTCTMYSNSDSKKLYSEVWELSSLCPFYLKWLRTSSDFAFVILPIIL